MILYAKMAVKIKSKTSYSITITIRKRKWTTLKVKCFNNCFFIYSLRSDIENLGLLLIKIIYPLASFFFFLLL